jgi:VWFA-related protein
MIRRVSVLLALFGIACPVFAAKQVTVAEFEQAIKQIQGKPDADAAWQIANLQLTERLSTEEFNSLESSFHGDLSRQALRGAADASDFLDPPTAELPSKPAPDFAEQRRIMSLVVAYVRGTIPQLPNLLATRDTVRFRDTPAGYKDQGKTVTRYEPLHLIGRSSVTVSYRDGREMQESETEDKAKPAPLEIGLNTQGEFGPVLTTVLLDSAQSKLAWSHWEQEDRQVRAVFAFSVPREKSHYQVEYCCIANSDNTRTDLYRQPAGYHGEMTVDPKTGTILRLTIEAALKAGEPVSNASVLVEYGSVEIAGKSYICPVRALALSHAQSESTAKDEMVQTAPMGSGGMFSGSAMSVVHSTSAVQGAEQTLLNDIIFEQYHVFRSEAHMLTTDSGSLAPQSAAELARALPALGTSEASSAGGNSAGPATTTGSSTNAAGQAPTETASSTSPSTAIPAPAAPSSPPAEPEISVSVVKQLPDLANPPATTPDGQAEITLRTTTRLVDVTLVAYDKKGHPVANLKASDLEVYDNGHKEELRFFNPASAETVVTTHQAQTQAGGASTLTTFTNRPNAEHPEASPADSSSSATILLIDAGNLAFGDLANARTQMLRFLKTLAPEERIGLYILRSRGVEVLQEPTLDHVQVATTLTQWMPNAQDLARAQDEERRNRQDIEYVHSVGDLLYLNGNVPTGESDDGLAIDPQLRSFGSNPSRDALILFPAVARHLATVVGHKTLVWISSDNVLADWSNKAPSVERGAKNIDPLALRAQETLNEAHVSIYPLDVSQLEAGGVGANTASSNAQLNPASQGALQAQLAALPTDERQEAQEAEQKAQRDINPGRLTAQLQANTHPIQGTFRELADATGGRAMRRASDITAELNNVVADGRAAYMLSFAPDSPADDQYHVITVKVSTRHDITLHYRAGYVYSKEPASFKDRFRQAIWDPRDINEIPLTASPVADPKGTALKLTIDATTLGLTEKADRWSDRLDVFVALRDQSGLHARVTGHSVDLRLLSGTYQQTLKDGIPFEQPINTKNAFDSARLIVVDENSGRIGSITVPASAFKPGS